MKTLQKFLPALLLTLSLAACQNVSNTDHTSAGDQSKQEKASSESQVSLTVNGDESNVTPAPQSNSAKTANVILTFNESGFSPAEIDATIGGTLSISNSLKNKSSLYTTSDGQLPCPFLDATMDIEAGASSKNYDLNQAGTCTILNQLDPTQRAVLNVK